MRKTAPLLLVLVVIVAVFIVIRLRTNSSSVKDQTTFNRESSSNSVNRDRGFDRRVSYLHYSNHATCRMQCRHITREEVEEAMRDGKINYNKSDIRNSRCPRYALEEVTKDNQRVRIVFAQCNTYTEVVTVIDLDTKWTCDCPGDDNKYKNRN
jgi:hypothetical protein